MSDTSIDTTSDTATGTTPTGTTPIRVRLAIRASRAEIWRALVDGAVTPAYYVGFAAEFDLRPGGTYRYTAGGGEMIAGRVVAVEPERRLVTTFRGAWSPDVAALPETTVTFELADPPMPTPGVTVLSCVHEGLPAGEMVEHLDAGWVSILSGLKTLLETGAPLAPRA